VKSITVTGASFAALGLELAASYTGRSRRPHLSMTFIAQIIAPVGVLNRIEISISFAGWEDRNMK
jgi:hypothetical protein